MALCIIRNIIKQHIDSISINFNVHVYGSRAIVFHNQIIIKQILFFFFISKACLLSKHLTLYHGQVINFGFTSQLWRSCDEIQCIYMLLCNKLVSSEKWLFLFHIMINIGYTLKTLFKHVEPCCLSKLILKVFTNFIKVNL